MINMNKFKRSVRLCLGRDMPFFMAETGFYSLYGPFQSRHYWFGVKNVIGICYSVRWGQCE